MAAPPINGFSISLADQVVEGNIYVGQILKPIIRSIPPSSSFSEFDITTSDQSLVYDSSGNLSLTSYSSDIPTVSLIVNDVFAVDDNYSASIILTTNPSVISITFDSSGATLGPFYTLDLMDRLTIVMSTPGVPLPTITWKSSKPSVATVDDLGLIKGLNIGVTTITASVSDYRKLTASILITVTPYLNTDPTPITSAEIYIPMTTFYGDTSVQAYLLIDPPNSIISTLTWSTTNPQIVYINPSTGFIRIINTDNTNGSEIVNVYATVVDSFSNSIEVFVGITRFIKVDTIVLNPKLITNLQIEEIVSIESTVYPANATNTNLTWSSSDTNIAIIFFSDVPGTVNVKGVSNGSCYITATSSDGTVKASTLVFVQNNLTRITTNIPDTLPEEATFQVNIMAFGSNILDLLNPSEETSEELDLQSGSYSTIFWNSSDSSVATISNTGMITAVESGTCTISIIVSGQSGTVNYDKSLTITQSVKNILVSPASLSLTVGQSSLLNASIFPSNVEDTSVTWESADSRVATVDSTGNVTAVKIGATTIKAIANGGTNIFSYIPVSVGIPITSATIVIPSTIFMGTTVQATVKLQPTGAIYDFISWSPQLTEKTSATVSQFGQISATGLFVPNIPISSSSVTQSESFNVIVGNQFTPSLITAISPAITIVQPVSAITMSQVYYTMAVGSTIQLDWTIHPESAHNQGLKWNSSSSAIASVTQGGLVTLNSVGDVIIKARSADTRKVSAITIINVTAL